MQQPDTLEAYMTISGLLRDMCSLPNRDLYDKYFDPIADHLDTLWYELSKEDIDLINNRVGF